ncbi:type II toxin-antitoxin system RelE/ParE family toxin [Methylocystis sp. WRRC1]|uniref:type II toxin-antitoxin system RelE/ParE family toxin n=1 Tax=unclassified Methylocystis TaxID=2625913 RepID=UPI0001F867B2|nr:type II toxin-antitoxin system RelE/ParE family toxin [Methylocystis sp. ATCC 49242]MCC3245539.1 type II toxin-antitoxin system RelE/ParE family toxin [Methylocystis sp. WRRC1]
MARVLLTSLADGDVDYIIADLAAKAGARIAARYIADFDKLYDRLAEYPDSGARRPSLGESVRVSVIAPYVVIYEHMPAEGTVVIMRIVHGRRNITEKLMRGS